MRLKIVDGIIYYLVMGLARMFGVHIHIDYNTPRKLDQKFVANKIE